MAVERKHYGRADRDRGGRRLGVLRARSDRSEKGRRSARARRRAAPPGRDAVALGQQEREPAAGVPVGEGLARRRQVLEAVRDAAGRRLGVGTAQGRSSGMGEGADLGRPRQLHDVDGRAAVSRRDLHAGEDHRGRPEAPRRAARRSCQTGRSTICSAARASISRPGCSAWHSIADRRVGARVQGARSSRSPTVRRVRSRTPQRARIDRHARCG